MSSMAVGDTWKAWFMARLADPPRGVQHRNWLANVMTLGTGRATVEAFARSCLPPAVAQSYIAGSADWTRLRLAHLYLMGLTGERELAPGADPHTLSRMAYHVRHMRSFGAVAFPNYDLDTHIKARVGAAGGVGRGPSGLGVISEEHFSNVVEAAVRGAPEDRRRALTLGLGLMYYCGIRPVSLSALRWEEILDIEGSRFLWARGRLLCLPAHLEEWLRAHRETAPPGRKALFDAPTLRALGLYSSLADTLPILRSARG